MNENNEFGERRKRKTDMAFLGTGMACGGIVYQEEDEVG
jgi:hypothetical protein